MRAEPAGHAAAEAAVPGHEEQAAAEDEGEETAGVHPEQRARGESYYAVVIRAKLISAITSPRRGLQAIN